MTPLSHSAGPQERIDAFFQSIELDAQDDVEKIEHAKEEIRSMTTEELAELKNRIEAGDGIPEIFRRSDLMQEVSGRLEALRTEVQDQLNSERERAEEREAEESTSAHEERAPATRTEKIVRTIDKTLDTVFPENWTTNQKRTVAAIGLGATILGAYLYMRGRKSVQTGSEAAKEAKGGTLKKIGIGLGIGIAAFFGLDWYFRGKISRGIKGAMNRIANGRDAVTSRIRDLEEDIRGLESMPDRNLEQERRLQETTAILLAIKSYGFQYDVAKDMNEQSITSPSQVSKYANEITILAKEHDVKMDVILECMETGDLRAYRKFLDQVYENFDKYSPEEQRDKVHSAKFVVGFVKKYRSSIEKHSALTGKNIKEMRYAEALNVFAAMPGFAHEAVEHMSPAIAAILEDGVSGIADVLQSENLRKIFDNPSVYSEKIIQMILAPLRPATSTNIDVEKHDEECKEITLFFVTNKNVTVKEVANLASAKWPGNPEKVAIAVNLCNQIKNDPQILDKILQAALVKTNAEGGSRDAQVKEKLQEILHSEKLSLSDAFQLYYLTHARGAGPMLTLKVINILGNDNYIDRASGEGQLAIDRYHTIIDKLVEAAIFGGEEEIEKLCDEYGVKDEMRVEMRNLSLYLGEKFGKAGRRLWDNMLVFAEHHPYIATLFGIAVVDSAVGIVARPTYAIFKAIDRIRWNKIAGAANMSLEDFARTYNIADGAEAERAHGRIKDIMRSKNNLQQQFDIGGFRNRRLRREGRGVINDVRNATPAEPTPRAPRNADAAEPRRNASGSARALESISQDDDLVRQITRAGTRAEDTRALLQLAEEAGHIKLDPDTLLMIKQSERAKKIIAGAIETTDVNEITRALRAAKRARSLRIAGNVAGAGLDVFGVYMAYADWLENNERIEETNNPALKELYAGARPVYLAEGAASAAGLAIGGVAMVKTYGAGGTILTAMGATGGLIMLPIGLAVVGTRSAHSALEYASETWLKTELDWQKHDNADLLAKLDEFAPGRRSIGQRFTGIFENAEAANVNVRSDVYRAYFRKNALVSMRPGETPEQYKSRYGLFVSDATRYINTLTGGQYMRVPAYELENALTFAEIAARARDLQERGESETITWEENGNSVSLNIEDIGQHFGDAEKYKEYISLYRKAVTERYELQQMCLLMNVESRGEVSGETQEMVQAILYAKIKHGINNFENRLRTVDFPGIGDTKKQNVVRGLMKRKLEEKASSLAEYIAALSANPADTTQEQQQEYNIKMKEIQKMLEADPIAMYEQASEQEKSQYASTGARALLYLVPGAMEEQMMHERHAS